MNTKHFLRGLGAGMILGAVIMLVAYLTSGSYKMTDKQVIERAGELGMHFDGATPTDLIDDDGPTTAEAVSTNTKTVASTETGETKTVSSTEAATEDGKSTEGTTGASTDGTTEAGTTEAKTTEATTEKKGTVKAKITVTSGMDSSTVAELLADAGIVDDAEKFDAFLNEKGYATDIKINTSEFNNAMTYEEIAKQLTTEGE